MEETAGALCERVASQRLPRWAELPDLELYMDQVLSLVERYLGSYPGFDGKGLTASMVNNYVKLGVMPAPVKTTRRRLSFSASARSWMRSIGSSFQWQYYIV